MIRNTCRRIHQFLTVICSFLTVNLIHHQFLVALLESGLHRRKQTLAFLFTHLETVDHEFDTVVTVAVQPHAAADLHKFTVDTHIQIPLFDQLFEKLFIMSLAVLHQRCENIYLLAVILSENELDNLFVGILHHLFPGNIASGDTYARIQQTQKIIYFRGRADSTARIPVDSLLLYRDDRAKTCDTVYIRTLESAEHIAGVG